MPIITITRFLNTPKLKQAAIKGKYSQEYKSTHFSLKKLQEDSMCGSFESKFEKTSTSSTK